MNKFSIPINEKEQLDIYSHHGSFAEGVAALEQEGLALMTARELAEARLSGGAKSPVSEEWTWVAENFNYFHNGDILVASREHSPLLRTGAPQKATDCHYKNKEFYLDKVVANELRERAEADPEKAIRSGVLLLSRKAVKSKIPSTALEDEPLTYFLFRDMARPYGQFLKEHDIDSIPLYVINANYAEQQKQVFCRALWVDYIDGRSGLGGDDDLCGDGGRVRGVRRAPREAGTAPDVPQEAKVEGLDNILAALKDGVAFNYNKVMYVPVRRDIIERAK